MAQSYENLKIWKQSIELATMMYEVTKKFPKEEQFGIVSQLRRAVISISSNIAEGSSRKSKKDYMRFVDIAIGSLNEVGSLVLVAKNLSFLSHRDYETALNTIRPLGSSLGAFRQFLQK